MPTIIIKTVIGERTVGMVPAEVLPGATPDTIRLTFDLENRNYPQDMIISRLAFESGHKPSPEGGQDIFLGSRLIKI